MLIEILCDKLSDIGCSSRITSSIYQLFSSRTLHFFFNDRLTDKLTSHKGLAQGSVLSPLLYNVYTLAIEASIPRDVHIIPYADDVVIYSAGSVPSELQSMMQSTVDRLTLEYRSLGLDISSSKSEFMVFTRKYKLPPFRVTLDGNPLSRSYGFKYLGVIFDPKCTWKQHTAHISRRCQPRINFMRSISNTSWGAHPDD